MRVRRQTPRSAAMFACSAQCWARSSSSRRAKSCSRPRSESGCELARAPDAAASTREEEHIEDELGEQITILWQTDEVRHGRPRLTDEIRHGLWFFEHSLPDAAEQLLAEYRARLPDAPSPLSFGTWIGGDMDGNPAAGSDTIPEALDPSRDLALGRYRSDVRQLAGAVA